MKNKFIKAFSLHGIDFVGKTGDNQRYGECLFCGKENKFYINEDNGLWDCKVCGLSGNYPQFLEEVCAFNQDNVDLEPLADNRELPLAALTGREIGHNGEAYTFPIRDKAGKLQDLRTYRLGGKIMGSANCQTGLWNIDKLVKVPADWPVYLCEGEWDGMAMSWLIKKLKKKAVAVATPGANTFKREWVGEFQNRKVICCYDNDAAGEAGQLTVRERLSGTVSGLSYIRWPISLPQGFDIRDLIVKHAIKKKKPKLTWSKLELMRDANPTQGPGGERNNKNTKVDSVEPSKLVPTTFEEVSMTIRKWLYLKSMDGVAVAAASMLSNKLTGDPLWMFLVAPPGGAKTEILTTFSKCLESYFASSLTPHSLISGSEFKGGGDPSLIPQLDGKVLIIKDFTTLLSKRDQEKDEIFGILRDAYDGSCSKVFGTGVKRSYESKFSILSAVTPKIYELAATHQAMGERFLKFCIGENLEHFSEIDIIEKAITNIQSEGKMRDEMAEKMAQFISWKYKQVEEGKLPIIPKEISLRLIALAQFGARLRGTVSRDRYHQDQILASPSAEIGSRIGKQLAKFAMALAIVHDRDEVSEDDYRLVKKCMLDTISQKTEHVVRELFKELGYSDRTVKTSRVSERTRFPQSTCGRLLSDLNLLKIVDRKGGGTKYEWALSTYIKDAIQRAGLYTSDDEINRKSFSHLNQRGIYKKKLVTKKKRELVNA